MTSFKLAILGLGLAVGASAPLAAPPAEAPAVVATPPGVSVRMTADGPVFVDARGMTLYHGEPSCGEQRRARIRPIDAEGDVDFDATVQRVQSCLEASPPLRAPAGAQAVGSWSVMVRPDGTPQWAYEGRPVHTSTRDKAPGDVNGSHLPQLARGQSRVLSAPLAGAPAGIRIRQTAAGVTLTDIKGRTLYFRERGKCDDRCRRDWSPLLAPALAASDRLAKDWSIVAPSVGVRQWAYRGRPLFTYVHDAAAHGEQVFGDVFGGTWSQPIRGWKAAVLEPAPRPPAGVTAQTLTGDPQLFSFGFAKTVYADLQGRPLYTIHCIDGGDYEGEGGGGVDCDEVGDDPRYWLSYCGGQAACARTWRPLPATKGEKPSNRTWTVVVINPDNPYAPVVAGRGQAVWAYKGRPVFTYAGDVLPGDFYGDDHGFGTTGFGQMQARTIPAQAFAPDVRPPALTIARTGTPR